MDMQNIPSSVSSVINYANGHTSLTTPWYDSSRRYVVMYNATGCYGGQYCQTNHQSALLFSIPDLQQRYSLEKIKSHKVLPFLPREKGGSGDIGLIIFG